MAPKTRLDTLVRLRETREEAQRRSLAKAAGSAKDAAQALAKAKETSQRDERGRVSAFEWDVIDVAHGQALRDLRCAESVARSTEEVLASARESYAHARREVEVARRLADGRREELRAEEQRREQRQSDEWATLSSARQRRDEDG